MLRFHGNICRQVVTRRRQRLMNNNSLSINYHSCSYHRHPTTTTLIAAHDQKVLHHQQRHNHHDPQRRGLQELQHKKCLTRRYYYCNPTTIKMSQQEEVEDVKVEEKGSGDGSGDGSGGGGGGDKTKGKRQKKVNMKQLYARDYNNRRAAYNRQVSDLRKQYLKEYKEQRDEEEALAKKEAEESKRLKLMKQRAKNFRSVENQKKQEQIRIESQQKFKIHLETMAVKRQAKNKQMTKARELIIQELEQEAPLWLTTTEEVDKAFDDHEQQQYLWSRPNGSGILGAPNPSIDTHFWRQYESHTWHMDKTYPTQREVLLQELLDDAYYRANIDEEFWIKKEDDHDETATDRLTKRLELEQKAKLRAMVRMEGRKSLLQKQRDILQTLYGSDPTKDEIPKVMPAPNVQILANTKEQEREGVQILLNDPTKFFQFSSIEQQQQQQLLQSDDDSDGNQQQVDNDVYKGPTLGKPTGLRDWLRESMGGGIVDEDEDPNTTTTTTNVHAKNTDSVFPLGIAKREKPDTRTPAQKKREEREEKMWAAARKEQQQQEQGEGGDLNIELAADNIGMDDYFEDPIDYDQNESQWDEQDNDEWMKGLDVERDSDILLNTPHERRFKKDDIQWVIDQMDRKIVYLEHQLMKDVSSYKYQLKAQQTTVATTDDQEEGKEDGEGEELNEFDKMLLTLTDEQIVALSDIDDLMNGADENDDAIASTEEKDSSSTSITKFTQEKLLEALKKVPGMTEDQVKDILQIQITNDDNDTSNNT